MIMLTLYSKVSVGETTQRKKDRVELFYAHFLLQETPTCDSLRGHTTHKQDYE